VFDLAAVFSRCPHFGGYRGEDRVGYMLRSAIFLMSSITNGGTVHRTKSCLARAGGMWLGGWCDEHSWGCSVALMVRWISVKLHWVQIFCLDLAVLSMRILVLESAVEHCAVILHANWHMYMDYSKTSV